MPRNRNKCNAEVKALFKQNHKTCISSKQKPHEITGFFLNQYLHHRPLINSKKYHIWNNLWKLFDDGKILKLTQEERENHNKETILNLKRDGAIPTISPTEIVNLLPDSNQLATDRQARYARRALLHQQHETNHTTHENEDDHWCVADFAPTKDEMTTILKK